MRQTRRWTSFAVAVLAAGALTACSSDTPEENSADACSSWTAYTAAVDDLVAVLSSETPTVGEVQDARDAVGDAYSDLEDAAEDVAADRTSELEDAWDGLESALGDVPDDDTLSEARASLQEEATGVRTAADGLNAELGCS
ncbi:hypothetical protein [Isoptericola dokdonensis]|uniref:Chromosome partition protein Smc n=1 Tax=Isoptericola dokdonensis DS-3 TaxID=1300344 RepID=A0A161HPN7_9MICO|nr:hypothetical protein [Isoptericola dokdonensis]ANC31002.1 hypothetical protein I598_1446 [Isoptericola dokdonensis DS-3]